MTEGRETRESEGKWGKTKEKRCTRKLEYGKERVREKDGRRKRGYDR